MTSLISPKHLKYSLFAFLYFCEGAPIGLIWWALPTELSSRGVSIEVVTVITGSLAIPWAIKFLWGPVIDRIRLSFMNYPRWVVLFQLGMAASLLPLGFSNVSNQEVIWACLLVHALFASAQDVATDAWAIQISEESERGVLNGMMQFGMILGRWVFGAGLLLASSWISFEKASIVLAGFLLFSTFLLLLSPTIQKWGAMKQKSKSTESFWKSVSRKNVLFGFLCALTAGLGYESIGAVVGPFLQSVGYSKATVGWFYTTSLVAMAVGSLTGGKLADTAGHLKIYVWSTIGIFLVALGYWLLSLIFDSIPLSAFVMAALIYVLIGFMIASSYSLFMDISSQTQAKATSFSLIMAGTNACESGAAFGVGRLIPRLGFPFSFLIMGGVSLISLFFLRRIAKGKTVLHS